LADDYATAIFGSGHGVFLNSFGYLWTPQHTKP
jgi:hypothetical protein